jgi:hypothetical protein
MELSIAMSSVRRARTARRRRVQINRKERANPSQTLSAWSLLGISIGGEIWQAGNAHFESGFTLTVAYFPGNDHGSGKEIMPKYWAFATRTPLSGERFDGCPSK